MSGFLTRAFERRTSTWPTSTVANPEAWLLGLLGQSNTNSGATVTHETAFGLPAFYACVRIVAEDFAKTPMDVYRRMAGGGKRKAQERDEQYLLHTSPSLDLTAFEWKMKAAFDILTRGNHYSWISLGGDGIARGIYPLQPGFMTVSLDSFGSRVYQYAPPGQEKRKYSAREILHVWLISRDGLIGIDTISVAREAIGLGLTLQEYAARFFANGAQPTGILTHPRTLSDDAHKRLKSDFTDVYSRIDQKHKVFLFEEGLQYTQIGINNEQAQMVESRMHALREVARFFRIPPFMLGDTEAGASYASIEQQALDYYRNTQLPLQVRFEQKLTQKLFTEKEARKFFVEFNSDILLRGDTSSRYEAHAKALQNGWLNINEVREMENRNPLPPEIGDVYRVQLNMDNAGAEPQSPDDSDNDSPAPDSTPTAEPAIGIEPSPSGADPDIQKLALNGAQVTALLDIIQLVATNQIPRDSAKNVIMVAFQLSDADAESILGEAGKGFTPNNSQGNQNNSPEKPDSSEENQRKFKTFQPIFSDLEARLSRRESSDISRMAEKCARSNDKAGFETKFKAWLTDHRAWLKDKMSPAYEVRNAAIAPTVDLADVIDDRLEKLSVMVDAALDDDGLAGVIEFFKGESNGK